MTGKTLRQSQQNYEAIVNSIDGIVWEADAQTLQFRFVSQQAEQFLGYSTDRWLAEPTFWEERIHPDDRAWVVAFCANATAEKESHHFEYRMIAADKRTVWLRDIITVMVENDRPSRLRGVMVDITERKRVEEELKQYQDHLEMLVQERTLELATGNEQLRQEITERKQVEEALRETHAQLEATLNALPDLLFEVDRYGRFYGFRAPRPELLHLPPKEFLGQTVNQILPKHASRIIMEAIDQAVETGQHTSTVYPLETPVGTCWFELSIATRGDPKMPNGRLIVLARDITERKQAEDAYRALVDHSLQGLLILQDRRVVFANHAFVQISGFTVEELLSLSSEEVQATVHPEDQALVWGRLQDRMAEKAVPPRYEYRSFRKDGAMRWLELYANRIEYQGSPALQIAFIDITERKLAEAALRESEARYRFIFEAAGVSIWEEDITELQAAFDNLKAQGVTDIRNYFDEHPDFFQQAIQMIKVVDVNDETLKLYGAKSKDEMLTALDKVFLPESLPMFKESLAVIFEKGEYLERENIYQNLQGEQFNGLFKLTIPNEGSKANRALFSVMDITERVQAEAEREKLVAELQTALAQVKQLSGLLPICANCKKIRNDKGYWQDVAVYIRDHSEAEFTHGICPNCITELYPGLMDK